MRAFYVPGTSSVDRARSMPRRQALGLGEARMPVLSTGRLERDPLFCSSIARYEKVREGGQWLRDAGRALGDRHRCPDQRRRVARCFLRRVSEAEVHWRAFLETLVAVWHAAVSSLYTNSSMIIQAQIGAARKAVLGGAVWQRCQYHLARKRHPSRPQPQPSEMGHRCKELHLGSGTPPTGKAADNRAPAIW